MDRQPATRIKMVSAVTKALGEGRIHAVVSTEAKDRDGDIIRASGWDLANFNKHPVLLTSHDYHSLRSQIGEWESMKVVGKQLEGVARYYIGEGNPEADWGHNLAAKGMAAYSVGFIPDFSKAKELKSDGFFPNFDFNGQELLETSHVTIPSNPTALQASKMKGLPAFDEVVAHFLQVGDAQAPPYTTTIGNSGDYQVWIDGATFKSVHGEHDHDVNGEHEHDEDKKLLALEDDFRALARDFEHLADLQALLQANIAGLELSTKFKEAIHEALREVSHNGR